MPSCLARVGSSWAGNSDGQRGLDCPPPPHIRFHCTPHPSSPTGPHILVLCFIQKRGMGSLNAATQWQDQALEGRPGSLIGFPGPLHQLAWGEEKGCFQQGEMAGAGEAGAGELQGRRRER